MTQMNFHGSQLKLVMLSFDVGWNGGISDWSQTDNIDRVRRAYAAYNPVASGKKARKILTSAKVCKIHALCLLQ